MLETGCILVSVLHHHLPGPLNDQGDQTTALAFQLRAAAYCAPDPAAMLFLSVCV
jgi:hypothetical protein